MSSRFDPKRIILEFCQQNTQEYGMSIKNFSSSWYDGMAFLALMHHFFPDELDYKKFNKANRRKNFEVAFEIAKSHAGVAPVLEVDDLIELSRFDTYSAQCIFAYVKLLHFKLEKHPANVMQPITT